MTPTTVPERGCGFRQQGGIYFMSELGPNGLPLEDFLIDPPHIIDPDALGVSPVGMTLIERDGVTHIIDWVGSDSYPNVADFIEEVRRFGLSRRAAKTLDFAKITGQSRILLVHARAHIEHPQFYQNDRQRYLGIPSRNRWCPKRIGEHEHLLYRGMCAGLWWEDIEGGDNEGCAQVREVRRDMPSFSYHGYAAKRDGLWPIGYRPAIFMALPLTSIHVVCDREGDGHVDAFARASMSELPTLVVEE